MFVIIFFVLGLQAVWCFPSQTATQETLHLKPYTIVLQDFYTTLVVENYYQQQNLGKLENQTCNLFHNLFVATCNNWTLQILLPWFLEVKDIWVNCLKYPLSFNLSVKSIAFYLKNCEQFNNYICWYKLDRKGSHFCLLCENNELFNLCHKLMIGKKQNKM